MKLFVNRKCDVADAKAILKNSKLNKAKVLKLARRFQIAGKAIKLMPKTF